MEHVAEVGGVGVSVDEQGRGPPAVILEVQDAIVPVFVTRDQARSMQLALEGIPFERPLTHDLVVDMVTELGGAIDRVRVDDVADGTFYAKIDVERYGEDERTTHVFDARPSDAIALALRVDCPIVVSDAVIEAAGHDPDEIMFSDSDED